MNKAEEAKPSVQWKNISKKILFAKPD